MPILLQNCMMYFYNTYEKLDKIILNNEKNHNKFGINTLFIINYKT